MTQAVESNYVAWMRRRGEPWRKLGEGFDYEAAELAAHLTLQALDPIGGLVETFVGRADQEPPFVGEA
jgi:hypothetical protein